MTLYHAFLNTTETSSVPERDGRASVEACVRRYLNFFIRPKQKIKIKATN